MNPYFAGVGLGVVLLLSFVLAGRGLGASGAMMRTVAGIEKAIVPEHVEKNPYLRKYGKNPFKNWLVFEVIGVFFGGMLSGALSGRLKRETHHGPRISKKTRWVFAFLGGIFFAIGARLARGCTSGVALSGGATLVVGSWATMMAIFAGGYLLAFFVRKQWI